MKNNKTFIVRAFDTDYGHDYSWFFSTKEQAVRWCDDLMIDYGTECGAYVYESDTKRVIYR